MQNLINKYKYIQALAADEVKEIIYGMLELLNPKEEHRQLAEITRDAFKNLRLTQVVKKGNLKISK